MEKPSGSCHAFQRRRDWTALQLWFSSGRNHRGADWQSQFARDGRQRPPVFVKIASQRGSNLRRNIRRSRSSRICNRTAGRNRLRHNIRNRHNSRRSSRLRRKCRRSCTGCCMCKGGGRNPRNRNRGSPRFSGDSSRARGGNSPPSRWRWMGAQPAPALPLRQGHFLREAPPRAWPQALGLVFSCPGLENGIAQRYGCDFILGLSH